MPDPWEAAELLPEEFDAGAGLAGGGVAGAGFLFSAAPARQAALRSPARTSPAEPAVKVFRVSCIFMGSSFLLIGDAAQLTLGMSCYLLQPHKRCPRRRATGRSGIPKARSIAWVRGICLRPKTLYQQECGVNPTMRPNNRILQEATPPD